MCCNVFYSEGQNNVFDALRWFCIIGIIYLWFIVFCELLGSIALPANKCDTKEHRIKCCDGQPCHTTHTHTQRSQLNAWRGTKKDISHCCATILFIWFHYKLLQCRILLAMRCVYEFVLAASCYEIIGTYGTSSSGQSEPPRARPLFLCMWYCYCS